MQRPLQNAQFGSKIKIAKNVRKGILRENYSCSVLKNRSKKAKLFENRDNFAKAIAFSKC